MWLPSAVDNGNGRRAREQPLTVELADAIRRRRMVRAFEPGPLRTDMSDAETIDELLAAARRAPAAGNTDALEFVVCLGDDTERYWGATMTPQRRARFGHPGLLLAPALVIVTTRPDAYPERYSEADKGRAATLGSSTDEWPVPFWWVDAGAAIENLLLSATDAGLGACLFGVFDHESAVKAAFGIPSSVRVVATIAVGRPGSDERPGRSARRQQRPLSEVRHHGRWQDSSSS